MKSKAKKAILITAAILISLAVIILGVFYGFAIKHYVSIKDYNVGYHVDDGGLGFTLDGRSYYSDSIDSKYEFKGTDEETKYRIKTSGNPLLYVVQDFCVTGAVDDPNGYVYKAEDDPLFSGLIYIDENIVYPSHDADNIRQLIVTGKYTVPSAGNSGITDRDAIEEILSAIEQNDATADKLIEFNITEDNAVWADYYDFPFFERLY